ncbi:regulatory protein MarR [Secundilactobacillus odoratitofui DSM 19909 = JCM 15043]|uniref:Regulatory protein MarR n=1 Tax=Secundilactobacillus odoratitofui DSM 19909 = JCM 15043 TaxID=1423776 RepID=A0A0R1LUU7_9LACO|nr:MarR family transcriptional regulator [Secundilactobacillus odoratitofui]KRK99483.1 regulatory protein MarR [Secundilactobacillus odoratitofui DSM 19909 = JCM 15043]
MKRSQLLDEYIDVYIKSLKYLDSFVSEPAMKYNLSFEQYLILHDIAQKTNVTLARIADTRGVTRSAISRQIKVLLKLDYIYQQRDEKDHRRQYLHLTPRGRQIEEILARVATDRFGSWIDIFGEDKAVSLLEFIREFSDAAKLENNGRINEKK